jgi:hypothetical protein
MKLSLLVLTLLVSIFTQAASLVLSGSAFASTSYIVRSPVHPQSQLPISARSDEQGVCKFLQYDGALRGSMIKATYSEEGFFAGTIVEVAVRTQAIVLDSEGNPVRQRRSPIINQITCLRN